MARIRDDNEVEVTFVRVGGTWDRLVVTAREGVSDGVIQTIVQKRWEYLIRAPMPDEPTPQLDGATRTALATAWSALKAFRDTQDPI